MDSSTGNRDKVREHAQLLLASIGVSRIIVVDDEYGEITVEDLIGICSELPSDRAAALPHLNAVEFQAPAGIWIDAVREKWAILDSAERGSLLAQAKALQAETVPEAADQLPDPQQGQVDKQAAASLEQILDELEGCEYLTLSLHQWQTQGDTLLNDDKAKTTVFLFDRDFRREHGTENEGITLIRDVQQANVGYCGLLSHTVTRQSEHNAWCQLVEDYDLERDSFVVIAKERLTGQAPDDHQFLRILRFVGLSRRYSNVRSMAWSDFEDSVDAARDALERLSVSDFDRIVFGSSRKEGIWEADTLFRVFGILMRREATERLRGNEALFSSVSEARRISAISEDLAIALGTEKPSDEALRIQRFECYESGSVLNRFHVPIDTGDIFEDISGSTRRRYILLVQSCDLMVRESGRRNYDKKYGRTGALVQLVVDGERRSSWGELPFYDKDTGKPAFANFADVHQALLAVLDLCVFQDDGVAKIDLNADSPQLLIQPWKERYRKLGRFYGSALKRCKQIELKQLGANLRLLALPQLSATIRVRATAHDRTISYGLKRVRRLRQPWCGALLTEFAQHHARAAFGHSFDHRVRTQPEASGVRGGGDGE